MSKTSISFYLTTSRMHIFRAAIREIGDPKFIRFLIKEDGSAMIMEAYHKKDFQSHRVPKQNEARWEMELRSMPLCELLAVRLNWDKQKSYRIPGTVFPTQKKVVFNLDQAEMISERAGSTQRSVTAE